MARLTIPDEVTSVSFTVTTPTTAFPISFALFDKADLIVTVDDVELNQSGFTFSGTLLEGGGYSGGTVTLNTAVDNVTVLIRRVVGAARASNFAPAGTVPVGSVDMALNRLTAAIQDAQREVARIQFQGLTSGLDASGARTAIGLDDPTNLPFQAATGGLPRSLGAKAGQEQRSILDFCRSDRTATQNTAGLNAALTSGKLVHGFGAEGQSFNINGPIILADGAQLIGSPNCKSVLVPQAGDYDTFQLQGNYITLRGFTVYEDLKTAGSGATFRRMISGIVEKLLIEDIDIEASPRLWAETRTSGYYKRSTLREIVAKRHRGPGFLKEWAYAYDYIEPSVTIDFNGSTSPNHTAYRQIGGNLGIAEGGTYCGLNVLGTAAEVGTTTAQIGFWVSDVAEGHFEHARSDSCKGGSLFDGCTNLHLNHSYFGLSDDIQAALIDCTYVRGVLPVFRGRKLVSGTANKPGLDIQNGNANVMLVGVDAHENTGAGISKSGATSSRIVIPGFITLDNGGRGIKTVSGGTFSASGGLMDGNTAGNYDSGGAIHQILASQNNGGAYVNVSGVGTG